MKTNTENIAQQKQVLLNEINELLMKIDDIHRPIEPEQDSMSEKVKRSVKNISDYAQNNPKTSAAAVGAISLLAKKWFKRGA
ncbi:MAG: hypothetical protein IKN18_02960 [Neisseriaceae bacterium]|nr:hypothetical protein [Neisseriaceae bacterium]